MRRWSWRKLLIHAAIEYRNPLGWLLADEFVTRCSRGQFLHWAGSQTWTRRDPSRRIVTSFACPPIPVREFDWCAHYDGEEEAGNYGWGATEAEAVQDFLDNCKEDHDERLRIGI